MIPKYIIQQHKDTLDKFGIKVELSDVAQVTLYAEILNLLVIRSGMDKMDLPDVSPVPGDNGSPDLSRHQAIIHLDDAIREMYKALGRLAYKPA